MAIWKSCHADIFYTDWKRTSVSLTDKFGDSDEA